MKKAEGKFSHTCKPRTFEVSKYPIMKYERATVEKRLSILKDKVIKDTAFVDNDHALRFLVLPREACSV